MIRHEIPVGVAPMAAERYVRRAWPMLPGHAVRELFKKKDLKINGLKSGPEATVCPGDELLIYIADKFLPAEAELSFDDGRIVAAVKPQGLPVDVDQDGVGADTLLTRLQKKYPSAQLCHRLDAATGGLVLAALDDEVCAQALETFKNHALRKRYVALAKGGFDKREGTLRHWLVKDARSATVKVVPKEIRGAKPIETRYRVVDERGGVARVELEPVTGRTHQLRAHMAYIGHPLMGDDKYGDRAFNKKYASGLCLWCAGLEIAKDSPMEDYRRMQFTAPLPAWWGNTEDE